MTTTRTDLMAGSPAAAVVARECSSRLASVKQAANWSTKAHAAKANPFGATGYPTAIRRPLEASP